MTDKAPKPTIVWSLLTVVTGALLLIVLIAWLALVLTDAW
jgi:hypothetical protein